MNLCIDLPMALFTAEDQEQLRSWGYDVSLGLGNTDLADCEVYVGSNPTSSVSLDQWKALKVVMLASAGYDFIPTAALKDRGIILTNARDVYSIPIAEYVIARLLDVYKSTRQFDLLQQQKNYEKLTELDELTEKKVLLLGTGSIAKEVAIRLKSFGCTILGMNSDGRAIEHFDQCYPLAQLIHYAPTVDIIVDTLPLNDSTFHIINADFFAQVNPKAVLVNIGRGPTVDEKALIAALDTTLKAAIIDVFEEEPLSASSPLWAHPKVYLSAHSSFGSNLNDQRRLRLFMGNLKNYISGQPLINRIF